MFVCFVEKRCPVTREMKLSISHCGLSSLFYALVVSKLVVNLVVQVIKSGYTNSYLVLRSYYECLTVLVHTNVLLIARISSTFIRFFFQFSPMCDRSTKYNSILLTEVF